VQEVARQLRALKHEGAAMLICEQNMHFTLTIAECFYILEKGMIHFSGSADYMVSSDASRKYLSV